MGQEVIYIEIGPEMQPSQSTIDSIAKFINESKNQFILNIVEECQDLQLKVSNLRNVRLIFGQIDYFPEWDKY